MANICYTKSPDFVVIIPPSCQSPDSNNLYGNQIIRDNLRREPFYRPGSGYFFWIRMVKCSAFDLAFDIKSIHTF